MRPGYEGGQMPLQRRLPKRGFTNIFRKEYVVVNIRDLSKFEKGAVVDKDALKAVGLLKRDSDGVKLLDKLLNGRGFLGRKESGEIRACAALALGKMRVPAAMAALEKAMGEQDPVVKSAVNRALRGEG